MSSRKPVFSGSWYPASATACEREIRRFLTEGEIWQVPEQSFVGGIVPHAGWFYSGAIACNVIHKLIESPAPDVFLIFGMHLPSGAPNYIMKTGKWETPFGELSIETGITEVLTREFSFKIETEKQFTPDNTIELQLPFIKYFFTDAAIVPMGVPPDKASLEIGKRAVAIAKDLGLRVKVLGSTDLTHYGVNYGFMPKGIGEPAVEWVKSENDRKVIDAMIELAPEKVLDSAFDHHNACCAGAAATAISAAQSLSGGPAHMVSYATSFDKSPSDSFVGYVGMVF